MAAGEYENQEMSSSIDDKIVISGMSGLFAKCANLKELTDVLYNQVDPITDVNSRWHEQPGVTRHLGQIPDADLESFDAQFFKVHYRLGEQIDPGNRKILELSYQAMYDAGVAPEQLNGKKTTVFIGVGFTESEKCKFFEVHEKSGLNLLGSSKTMQSNRISYWLNSNGPSASIDQACCGSIAALELACRSILAGECEAAIVGGSSICIHPQTVTHYQRMGVLSSDGKTKSFDKNANGYVRSDAVSVLFLQKGRDAKRCYAEVVLAQSKFMTLNVCDTGREHGYYHNPENTVEFLEQFYKEAKVSPQSVKYVEAFGSAIPDADKAELDAIDDVFCKGRKEPLLVGSVMSNIGYTETASGISGITKVLLAYNTGKLAANMHCTSPRDDIESIRDGRIRIVTENKPLENSAYVAINNLSYNGVNGHVLLRGFNKPKNISRYKCNIPHLVLISGRQESSVHKILLDLKSRPIDSEELALFHHLHETRQSGHLGRGYIILDTDEAQRTISLKEEVTYFDSAPRPLWFVYSGMGSQWVGMGRSLMQIPIFATAINKCHAVLEQKGLNLINIITSSDPKMFDNILNSFVGIAAIQIGLTDVLTEIGIVPDNIIGHSVGELGCAYADGCLTAEEMILSAYSRGLVSIQSSLIFGAMAAVGVGYQQVSKMLPLGIEVACHNSSTSCTISGPADALKDFVGKLTSQGIFAKEVPCSNIAYHSSHIAKLGPCLFQYLNEVIKTPKLRTKRWLSTSVPQNRWNEPSAMYSSAEYHTNNLLKPVLFEEIACLIPNDAVVVEVAPHGLLQAILKRSLPVSCKNLSLTQRGHFNMVQHLLQSVGELYMVGYNPIIRNIYPKVEFPVSTGTPMLSHLVDWMHNEKWKVPLFLSVDTKVGAASQYLIATKDDEYSYLRGNQIKDRVVYPFAAALMAVWDSFAFLNGTQRKHLSVQYSDVRCDTQPLLSEHKILRLFVSIQRGTGRFEVLNGKVHIISGFIKEAEAKPRNNKIDCKDVTKQDFQIYSDDIYKLFNLRDFNYINEFRSIHRANLSLTNAQIVWSDNWVTFLDGLLQLNLLRHTYEGVSRPIFIKNIDIDVSKHFNNIISLRDGPKVINADVSELENSIRCGGIYLNGIQLKDTPLKHKGLPVINVLKLLPHFSTSIFDELLLQYLYLQIVAENTNKEVFKVLNMEKYRTLKERKVSNITNSIHILGDKINLISGDRNDVLTKSSLEDVDVVLVENLSRDINMCQTFYSALSQNTFIINTEKYVNETTLRSSSLYRVVCQHNTKSAQMELLLWRPSSPDTERTNAISVFSQSDLQLFNNSISDLSPKQNLVVFSSYPPLLTLKDSIKTIRKETNKNICLIMVNNEKLLHQYPSAQNTDSTFRVINDDGVGGEYYVPIEELPEEKGNMKLECAHIGDLTSLRWVTVPESTESGVTVMAHYAGLSTIDARSAAGVIPLKENQENTFGMEFSGVIERNGTRVMGLVKNGAVKTRLRANRRLMWPVPKHWSLEEAATVPLAYCLAFYCLTIKTRLFPGMRIFVHAGAGALGQAIISIALAHGCDVFTTVSSVSRKRFLRRLFPELMDDHIGNSRDVTFADLVAVKTKNQGCNVVVCNAKGDLKNTTITCCGQSGIIIDTSFLHEQEDYSLGMSFMAYCRGYTIVDLMSIFSYEYEKDTSKLQLLVSEGIARGYVRPISRIAYGAHDASRAFELLLTGQHCGRVLLNMKDVQSSAVLPILKCSQELCHLVISDNDALGIQFVEKLISRGAKKLYLQWKSPSELLQFKTRAWQSQKVKIYISSDNVMEKEHACNMLRTLEEIGLEGVYLLANEDYANEIEHLFEHWPLLSKPFNVLLKYATIVHIDNNSEKNTCDVIHHNQIRKIKLPKIRDFNYIKSTKPKNCVPIRSAVDAIEYVLAAKKTPLGLCWSDHQKTILENILTVAGVDVELSDYNIQSKMSLKDLGLNACQVQIVKDYLHCTHNVLFSEKDMGHLTLEEINRIEEDILEDCSDVTHGLWNFISHIEPDELKILTSTICMQTLTTKREGEYLETIEVAQKYLIIVPGLEGNQRRFGPICERLKVGAILFQPGCDKPNETIQEMAHRAVQIMPKVNKDKTFILVGYEYGVLVALEMAAILENEGLTGTVYCFGGTPDDVLATFNEKLKEFDTDEMLQEVVVRHLLSLMVVGSTEELDDVLNDKILTWEEKLEKCVWIFRGRTGYSTEYARQLIKTTYARLVQVRQYKSAARDLRSQLVFIRPTPHSDVSSSFMPQTYSQKPPMLYNLRLPLFKITQDLSCSAIINRHLDKDIVVEFEKKNFCGISAHDISCSFKLAYLSDL